MTKKTLTKIKSVSFIVAICLVSVLAIGGAVVAYDNYKTSKVVIVEGDYIEAEGSEMTVGAFPGPDIYNDINIHGKLTDGGKITNASSTLTTNLTLTAKQVCEGSVITVNSAAVDATIAAASLTITLPATSTLWTTCLFEEGAHTEFFFANLSPTAASTTVITAGTGMDLLEAGDGSVTNVVIGGGDRAKIELYRQTAFESNLDVYGIVTEFSAAD